MFSPKFKIGDKVRLSSTWQRDVLEGIVVKINASIWVRWKTKTNGFCHPYLYLEDELTLIKQKENHPHTNIFK